MYESYTCWGTYAAGVTGWPCVSGLPYYHSISKFRLRKEKFFSGNADSIPDHYNYKSVACGM